MILYDFCRIGLNSRPALRAKNITTILMDSQMRACRPEGPSGGPLQGGRFRDSTSFQF